MTKSTPTPVTTLLSENPHTLGRVMEHVHFLQRISDKLYQHLDTEAQAMCHVVNYRDEILILGMENGAWATRIRYLTADLLNVMRHEPGLERLKKIECTVRPKQHTIKKSNVPIALSQAGEKGLAQLRGEADHDQA